MRSAAWRRPGALLLGLLQLSLERFPLAVLLRESSIVTLCLVLVRLGWVIPSTYGFRSLERLIGGSDEPLPSWKPVLFVGWAGLRGGDSLVLALALPLQTAAGASFPAREEIIFITFCVIFITLVVQGPTLALLLHRLHLRADASDEAEESHARLAIAEAGLRALDDDRIASGRLRHAVTVHFAVSRRGHRDSSGVSRREPRSATSRRQNHRAPARARRARSGSPSRTDTPP